jgi:hypothetical protein
VTAREHQAQPIVRDLSRIEVGGLDGHARAGGGVGVELLREPSVPADAVDRLVPGRLDDPGPRVLRSSRDPPLVNRGRKRFLRRLFRDVEVADEPDERGDDQAPIRSINGFDGRVGIPGHTPP